MPRLNSPLQRWLLGLVGAGLVILGAVLTLRPFTSLGVLILVVAGAMVATGVADIARGRETKDRSYVWAGAGWIVGGLAVLVWPGASLKIVTLVVGIAMTLSGALRIWAGLRGARPDRITPVLSGAASLILGVLALSWPDITILVIAIVFGVRTILDGFGLMFDALTGRDPAQPHVRSMTRFARVRRASGALLGLVLALALVGVSVVLHGTAEVDDFYTAPANLPDKPGQLLRSEPFTTGIPAGAQAWRILYTTTRDDGQPALSSGIVVASKTAPTGARPVLAWAHGTTGYAEPCAPSLSDQPFVAGAMPAVDQVIDNGWALVATDYIGLGTEGPHTYMIGQREGRAVLDAVRAARQLDQLTLSDKTVVWGHSQGGGSALWTGQLAPTYAPDVPLAGVVAMAPASDLIGFSKTLETMPGGSIFQSFIITAYSEIYPDVKFSDYVRPGAHTIEKKAAHRCLNDPSTLVSIATSIGLGNSVFSRPATEGGLGERLRENTATGLIQAPLLIAQGTTDPIVLKSMQDGYVARLCDSGQPLDYRLYKDRDHIGLVADDSPLIADLLAWTQARFAGTGQSIDTCSRK